MPTSKLSKPWCTQPKNNQFFSPTRHTSRKRLVIFYCRFYLRIQFDSGCLEPVRLKVSTNLGTLVIRFAFSHHLAMPNSTQAYQASLTQFIQAHMVMIGPRVILSALNALPGIQVTNTGVVNQLNQDPALVIQRVRGAFSPFGGVLTQRLHSKLFSDQTSASAPLASRSQL